MSEIASPATTRNEIVDLLTRFAWTADVDNISAFESYFTDDAIWDMGELVWTGRDAIITGLDSMRTAGHAGPDAGTRHLVHNIDIITEENGQARVRSLYTLVSAGSAPQILSIGTYEDEIVDGADGWRLLSRKVRAL